MSQFSALARPIEAVITTPPLICTEVLSPLDRLPRAKIVMADYFSMGVPNIWLTDPIRQAAYTFDATGLHGADATNLRSRERRSILT